MLNFIYGRFSKDLGIDLGTANTLVFMKGKGILLQEPTVVAIDRDSGNVFAVGEEARQMVGRTPGNIIAVKPLKDGVIADFDITEKMLQHFIRKTHRRKSFLAPRVVVGVPSGVTSVERRAVLDACLQAGAREAFTIDEPMAAAIGAGLPIHEATGNLMLDIGGGTTEVAVISLGGIVNSKSIRVGGNELDESVMQYIKRNYNLMIGERTAEEIKRGIGSAHPEFAEGTREVRGRDLVTGLPKTIEITAVEIMDALSEPVALIVDALKMTLEKTPPELAADILDKGLMMAGGGSLLKGLDQLIREETGMPVHRAEDPLTCVARGTGMTLENLSRYESALISSRKVS